MKKYLLIILTFLSFLGISFLISDVQSTKAQFTLATNGLTAEAKEITSPKNTSIKNMVTYAEKSFPKTNTQIQLISKSDNKKVLIWANFDLPELPTEKGRYFSKTDFAGKVTFSIISDNPIVEVLNVQNNKYINQNGQYIAVIGTLKQSYLQDRYYLTTGALQSNSSAKLKNYQVVVDGLNKTQLKKFTKYLSGKSKTPSFIKQVKIDPNKTKLEFGLTIALIVIILILSVLMAVQTTQISIRSNVKGSLLEKLLTNKVIRFAGVSLLTVLLPLLISNFTMYFSKQTDLVIILAITWVLEVITFTMTVLLNRRKD